MPYNFLDFIVNYIFSIIFIYINLKKQKNVGKPTFFYII